jgi:hypothetical protein
LYTHSISWALHGIEAAKNNKGSKALLGNLIDSHIRAGRYGQTNGISQGSVLMDFVAEIVLGYVDELITKTMINEGVADVKILRYRDDYRIFSNSDTDAENTLKIISDSLRFVGMRLGVSKTIISDNVVSGSIKSDKLAGIDLADLGYSNAKTIQKQFLRIHSFARRFPNSGSLRRLVGDIHQKIVKQKKAPNDLEVQIAIATDIAVLSPATFPAIAGILSHLISLAPQKEKKPLWTLIHHKMKKIPYNGFLEIWLQRITKPSEVGIGFESDEKICKVVNGEDVPLWDHSWISRKNMISALKSSNINVMDATSVPAVIKPKEISLFIQNSWLY